jgi:hypothetical protein
MKDLNAKYNLDMVLNLKISAIFLMYLLLGKVRSDLAALDLTLTTQNRVLTVQIMSRFNFEQKCTNKEYFCAEKTPC